MSGELLTVEELTLKLKTSRRNIERLRKKGMPYLILGRSPRFDYEAVLRWMKESKEMKELSQQDVEF